MAVTLHQAHYRFAANSGTVASPVWLGLIDTPISIETGTTFLLRIAVWETTGDTNALNTFQQFQCRKNGGAWQNITTGSTICRAVTTAVFADAATCSPALLGAHGSFDTSNAGCTHDGSSGGNQNDIPMGGSSETLCALQLQSADLQTGDVVDFRLTVTYSTGSTIVYDFTPTLTVNEPSTSASVSSSRSASLSPSRSASVSASRSASTSASSTPSVSESASPSGEDVGSVFGRPAVDLAAGTWTPSSGTLLYAMLNETDPVDTTYIRSAEDPTDDTAKIRFSGLSYPGPGTVTLRIRAGWGPTTIYPFIWSSVPTATTYRLQVGTGSGFSNVLNQDVGYVLTTEVPLHAGTYFFRVAAYNGETLLSTTTDEEIAV